MMVALGWAKGEGKGALRACMTGSTQLAPQMKLLASCFNSYSEKKLE